MKKIIVLGIAIMSMLACEKEDKNASKATSVENKEWYKTMKASCDENAVCKISIKEARYNNDTVYYSNLTGPLCDPVFSVTLLNSNGEVVKSYTDENIADFNSEVTFIKTLYSCN